MALQDVVVATASSSKKEHSLYWHHVAENLYLYVSPELIDPLNKTILSRGFIAAFDLDFTLAKPKYAKFPKSISDIYLMPKRKEKLEHWYKEGRTIVIFTNQKSTTPNKIKFQLDRLNIFLDKLQLPVIILMATAEDIYRKPNIGMWLYLETIIPNIQKTYSAFCGDAAGREDDFSDSDLKFAQNIGIIFLTPEEAFD